MGKTLPAPRSTRKARRSFTLSPESILFLETVHRQRRAASVSAVLDDIIQGLKRAQERDALDRTVTSFYSGLSADEAQDQSEWGEFSLGELLAQEPA